MVVEHVVVTVEDVVTEKVVEDCVQRSFPKGQKPIYI